MSLLQLTPAIATHRGMRRRHNEDAISYRYPSDHNVLRTHGALFVVADGVGGLEHGDEASQMTVAQVVAQYYASDPALNIEQRLTDSIEQVNETVYRHFQQRGATTLVVAVIVGDQLVTASVGDSQIFHVAGDAIAQLNEADVLQNEDGNNGALTKAIGYRETVAFSVMRRTVQSGECVLLCSDGLTRYIPPHKLIAHTRLSDPRDAVRRMINQANHAGGADNISVALIHIGEPAPAEQISAYIEKIAIPVAIDTAPMMMQDVPSKPTTQIPQARPQSQLDESLLERPAPQTPQPPTAEPAPVSAEPIADNRRTMTWIIVASVAVLVIGLIIFGMALASLSTNDERISEATPIQRIDETNNVQATDIGLEIGDMIWLDDIILTSNSLNDPVNAFLTKLDRSYEILNIAENNEGQLWYHLLEQDTGREGWVLATEMPTYTSLRD